MPLSDVLARIPGLGGYLAQQQLNQQKGLGEMQQASGLMQLMQQVQAQETQKQAQQEKQKALARDETLRGVIAQAGSPEAAIPLLIQQGPEGIKLAGVLAEATKDLRNPAARRTIVPPGSTVLGEDNQPLYTAPDRPEKDPAPPELVRLQKARDALPPGSPLRAEIDARIRHLNAPPAGVTVNMPPSSDTMYDPTTKKFYKFQVGKDGKTRAIPIETESGSPLQAPPTAADAKAAGEASEVDQTVASVRARVAKMASLVRGGAMAGGTVGPLGLASRVGETARGAVSADAPTPAIDFKNEQSLLLADVRKMVEKDPNLSKDERERLYETLGGGIMQTPGSSIRTLNNVLNYVESKKVGGKSRQATIEGSVKAAGWAYEPNKYDYRVVDGKVQRKAK